MKRKTILKITGLIVLAVAVYSAIGFYHHRSQKEINPSVEQELARKKSLPIPSPIS